VKKRGERIVFDHSGSSFDSFLEEEGIREEVEAVAIKRVLAWQLSQEMQQQKKTKQAMARDLQTSRSQLDRLLDPGNVSVSLHTMARAARVLGKSLVIRMRDRKPGGAKHHGAAIRSKEQPIKRPHRHGAEIEL
jgi:high-affinity Fe2+/Pb2+ permease